MNISTDKLRTDFNVYASVERNGERFMTETDLFQCFGVGEGHALYEEALKDESGLVSFGAYALLMAAHKMPKTSLQEAFAAFDNDNDGYIGLQEFQAVINSTAKLNDVQFLSAGSSSSNDSSSFTHRYFGHDGSRKVTYQQFHEMLRELNMTVLQCKWRALTPDASNTVSLASFGSWFIQSTHDLPPVLAKNLLSPSAVRLTFKDYVTFYEVLENLEELEELLELEMIQQGKQAQPLSREAFNRAVSTVSQRRELEAKNAAAAAAAAASASQSASSSSSSAAAAVTAASIAPISFPSPASAPTTSTSGSGSVVMDIMFSWLDSDGSGHLDAKEVRSLLPLLQSSTPAATPPRKLALWENIVLGGSSAAIAGTVVYPMDTIKARLMNGQGTSIAGTFKEIVAKQGPMALYRGLPAQLIGIMPEKALKLTIYNTVRGSLMDPQTQQVTYRSEMFAGFCTALVQVAITNPYELIKVRQQTIPGQPITETMRQLGFRGLTQGLGACLLRDIPFNMLYFSSYAALKDQLKDKEHLDAPLSPYSLMAAGLGAGLLAGGLSTPADVIKTRMQTDTTGRYKGIRDCMSQMWAEGGAKTFMKGLGPRVMLIPPMFAITMTCFETFQRMWFPQTVNCPKMVDPWHVLPRHSMAEVVRHRLKRLDETLATECKCD